MKRAALYCRVSSLKQVREGDSLDAQISALRKYVAEHNYLVNAGENRLTYWSEQSFKAEERWTRFADEGKEAKAAAARRRMIATDGKIDAAIEILAVMGYAVTWVEGKARIMEGK